MNVTLTPLHIEHAADFAGQIDERIAGMTISMPYPCDERAARAWIYRAREQMQAGTDLHFAVLARASDAEARKFVGYVALRHIDHEHRHAEISFWIGSAYEGLGFATEAGTAMAAYGFEHVNLNRITAYHMTRNPASGRVLGRMGLRYEGVMRQRVLKSSRIEDACMHGITRADYDARLPLTDDAFCPGLRRGAGATADAM